MGRKVPLFRLRLSLRLRNPGVRAAEERGSRGGRNQSFVFTNCDQGGNHPDANTANKEEKIYPKGAALDLLFGQRGMIGGRGQAGGGRRSRIHRLDMARMTTIRTSRLAKTYCKVLHTTTTMKVKGSINRLRLGLGLRR